MKTLILLLLFISSGIYAQKDLSSDFPRYTWSEDETQLKNIYPSIYNIPREGNDKNYSSSAVNNLIFGAYLIKARFVMDTQSNKLIRTILKPMDDDLDAETSKIIFGYFYAKLETLYGSPKTLQSTVKSRTGLSSPHFVWILENMNIHLTGWWLVDVNSTQIVIDNKSMPL